MKPKSKPLRSCAVLLALLACGATHAAQTKQVRDGVSVEAIVSRSEPTRVRVEGAKITNVVGNIYSSTCAPKEDAAAAVPAPAPAVNPQGEFVLSCDLDKGEVFISPVVRPGQDDKPINVFVSTGKATYTLYLRRADVPADTIVLVDKSAGGAGAGPKVGKSSQHVRGLKEMLLVMAGERSADDISAEAVNRENALWKEVRLQQVREYRGRGLVGEEYRLTNVSDQALVLAEQEFDRPGGDVLAVAIDHLNLQPSESTTVYVIRAGE